MTSEVTITKCIEKYAENQKKKEEVGGEKQEDAKHILNILEKVGGKITEVSFLKSIIKHNILVVFLTSLFFEQKSNHHFNFLLGC